MSEEQAAALHEAGHALVGVLVGAEVEAYLRGSAGGGRCKTSITISADDNPEARAIRDALISMSGLISEDIFLPGAADAGPSQADLLELRAHYETLVRLKSAWAGCEFGTFKGLVSGVVGILLRRYRSHVETLASDLRAYDSGLSQQDVWNRCSDLPRDLAGKGWSRAFLKLCEESIDALEARLPAGAVARKYEGRALYGAATRK